MSYHKTAGACARRHFQGYWWMLRCRPGCGPGRRAPFRHRPVVRPPQNSRSFRPEAFPHPHHARLPGASQNPPHLWPDRPDDPGLARNCGSIPR